MSMFDPFLLDTDQRSLCGHHTPLVLFPRLNRFFRRPLIVRVLNIALASLATFSIVGSACCAFKLVFSH